MTGSSRPLRWMVTATRPDPQYHTQAYTISSYSVTLLAYSYICMLTGMPGHRLSLTCPRVHTSSILHPLRGFCGCVALKSGRPIRSIYCRASRHANNTKHTNGKETKPQATDIQSAADHSPRDAYSLFHLTMQVHRGTNQNYDFLKSSMCYHLLCDLGNLRNCLQ